MIIEKILKIRMTFIDTESEAVDTEELTEFIIDTLNSSFQKDFITFEAITEEE